MIISPSSDKVNKQQLDPTFSIHSKYIHCMDKEYNKE